MDFNNRMNSITNDAVHGVKAFEVFEKVGSGEINPREGSKLILDAMIHVGLDI